MDSYVRQMSRGMWNCYAIDYFSISIGVNQGRVISPNIFNLYLDTLLILLKQSGRGFHINEMHKGAPVYEYGIRLTYPSVYDLNGIF